MRGREDSDGNDCDGKETENVWQQGVAENVCSTRKRRVDVMEGCREFRAQDR